MGTNTKAILIDADKRQSPRREVSENGMTFAQGQFDATTCIVKDISDTGARIALDDENCFVPKRLKLYIAERDFLADCEQVWRKGCEVGLDFISGVSIK